MRFLLLFFLITTCLLPGYGKCLADDKLYVSVWAEYLPSWVFKEFSEESGIKVVPQFYAHRNSGYTQLLAAMSQTDLALTCQEHLDMLKMRGSIEPIDFSKLRNIRHLQLADLPEQISKEFTHAVPFDWHLLGFLVNRDLVDPELVKSCADLWNPMVSGKVYLPDESRILVSVALLSLGYSANSGDAQQLKQAGDRLKQLLPLADAVSNYGMIDAITRGSTAVAVVWNGMPSGLNLAELSNLVFVLPQDTPLLLVESWVIPANAANREAAYAFIDFLMRPDIANRISHENGYPTINQAATLPHAIDTNVLLNPPPTLLRRAELEHYVPAISDLTISAVQE